MSFKKRYFTIIAYCFLLHTHYSCNQYRYDLNTESYRYSACRCSTQQVLKISHIDNIIRKRSSYLEYDGIRKSFILENP